MTTVLRVLAIVFMVVFAGTVLSSMWLVSVYNRFPTHQVKVDEAWAKLQTAYKKRADLLPRAAEVAQRYMDNESRTIIEHARARASMGGNTLPSDATPEQIKAFNEAQRDLSAMASKILVLGRESTVSLKADSQFMMLQKQLRDVEAQVQANRNIYIREVAGYNLNVTRFPSNLIAKWGGFEKKAQLAFEDAEQIKEAPVLFKK